MQRAFFIAIIILVACLIINVVS